MRSSTASGPIPGLKSRQTIRRGAACWLALLTLAACAAPASGPPAQAPAAGAASGGQGGLTTGPQAPAATAPADRRKVSYGYIAILAGAPTFVAQDRGYFDEQGLDVEFTPFDSGALLLTPVSAGQLDVGAAVPSPGLFNALARNINMKAIASQSGTGTFLMLRQELADSGQVKSLGDLRGRRVSFNVEGSPVDFTLRTAFRQAGIDLGEVDVQRVTNTDLAPALVNGAVDAGGAPEPLPVLIESRGAGVRFLDIESLIGPHEGSFLMIGPSMLGRDEVVTQHFLVAYMQGLREYLAAVKDGKVADPAMRDILSKWTRIPTDVIAQASVTLTDPNGRINLADLNFQQDFWAEQGLVTAKADLGQFLEYKYLDAALAKVQ